MKQRKTTYRPKYTKTYQRYPNVAARSYKLNKLVDYLLTVATAAGIVVAVLFLVTL